jgi:hypothetical protein
VSGRDEVVARLLNRPVRQEIVAFAENPADADRLRVLQGRVLRAQNPPRGVPVNPVEVADAEAELAAFQAMLKGRLIRFTLEPVDPKVWDALEAEHPPTDQQKAEYKRAMAEALAAVGNGKAVPAPLRYNTDTFPAALVAAAVARIEFGDGEVADSLHPAEAEQMWASRAWPEGDLDLLFQNAEALSKVNTSVGDLGKD